jgi:DNA-binding beta-propeller fold protein YncE
LVALLVGCDSASPTGAERLVNLFGEAGLGRGQFSYPRVIAISPVDGRVFVCDKTARIQRFKPSGEYETEWRMPEWEQGKPTGMSVDPQGRVWVADTHYSRVIVFDRDGAELFRFGRPGRGGGEFMLPTSITWDREGNIYVGEFGGNDRISKFTPDRAYLFSFAGEESGVGAVSRPTQMRFDEEGVLWVSDACHHRICRYDADGRFLGSFGRPGREPENLNYPYDLAFLPGTSPLVLVADHGNDRIVAFDRSGGLAWSWGEPGREPGQIFRPWGVAAGAGGLIYVLDSWNNRVQVIR